MAGEVAFLPATRLMELYRSKQLSPVEVIEDSLRRLESYEGATNAFVLYDPRQRWRWPASRKGGGKGVSRRAFSMVCRWR